MKALDSRSTGASRTLTAYAFLAQATHGETDLLRGLAPLFRPIAKANAGKHFDPRSFASAVADLYGFRIHPWALEDFAPRLAEAGILNSVSTSQFTHDYIYASIAEDFVQLSENDVASVITQFVAYARPLLEARAVEATDAELEGALLTALTSLEFIGVLLRPEKPEGPTGRRVLTMSREPEAAGREAVDDDRARLDVLCAGFILHVYRTDRATYELLTQIVSGALITEVVLEFQAPSVPCTLEHLTVVLDAPFLMSLLNLGTEEAHGFAADVVAELKRHGAKVATFRHCVDEIRDNLRAVISATRDGVGHGPTARRLHKTSFAAYAGAIQHDPETRLSTEGIEIVEMLATERWYHNFTHQDEEELANAIGHYENPVARDRDAASIAAILRFRKGERVRMARFHTTRIVFVTENPRLVRATRRLIAEKQLHREGEVPPAITDKYLAGLLWALFGGKAKELAPKLLLANCAAALEPRSDLLAKMHRFIAELSPEQIEYFTALMTTERAAQHLMELTLGDSEFLTRENAISVLERLTATLIEKQKAEANDELRARDAAHDAQLSELERGRQDLETRLRDEEVLRLEAETALRASREQTRIRLQRIAGKVHRRERWAHYLIAGIIALVVVAAGMVTSTRLSPQWTVFGWLVTALCAFVGFWKVPDLLLRSYLANRGKRDFLKRCAEECLIAVDDHFIVDLSEGTVRHKGP